MQSEQIALDHDGNVRLCPALYDPAVNEFFGSYFDLSLAEIQARRYSSNTWARCKAAGVHIMTNTYCNRDLLEEVDELAGLRVSECYKSNSTTSDQIATETSFLKQAK